MSSFNKYQPIGLRVWHWFNAFTITGLLLTVALRKTLFSIRGNTEMIKNKATELGTPIEPKLAKGIAEALVDHLWDWHHNLGYILGALLLVRILVWFVNGESPFRFKRELSHYSLVRTGYLTFYIAVLFMVGSGLAMIYQEQLHISDDTATQLGEVHELFQWFFLAFIVVHIAGVVFAELGKYKGIVSAMIHGGDRSNRSNR